VGKSKISDKIFEWGLNDTFVPSWYHVKHFADEE